MSGQWHGGKGSAPRKGADRKAYEDNWERIFGKKEKDMPTPCGCGRSPTGYCEGWHGLSTEEYMVKMKEYKEQKALEESTAEEEKGE